MSRSDERGRTYGPDVGIDGSSSGNPEASCVFVLGVLAEAVASVTAMVGELGLLDAGPSLGDLDHAMIAALDAGPYGDWLSVLGARVRRQMPASPWVLAPHALGATLKQWRQVLTDVAPTRTPLAILVSCPLTAAPSKLGGGGRRTEAVTLALWERSTRQLLGAVDGMATLVIQPGCSAQGEVEQFLTANHRATLAEVQPTPMRASARGDRHGGVPAPPKGSPEQMVLDAMMEGLEGRHRCFSSPGLPDESPATAALIEADRCFARELDRLETCLAGAFSAVEGLAPSARPAPPPFQPSYGLDAIEDAVGYSRWLVSGPTRQRIVSPPTEAARPELPSISVVVVVERPDAALLQRCVSSVTAQTHGDWQLCLVHAVETAEAGPPDSTTIELVEAMVAADSRICAAPPTPGTVAAANAAAELAAAPFLAFLGQHDELDPEALAAVAGALSDDAEIEMLYTDEDEIDTGSQRRTPRFKPGWSPDLLLSTPYIGHLLVVRRSVFQSIGGLRPELTGSEQFDLALRVTERARRVAHVPRVAYHRRVELGPPARDEKVVRTDRLALESALARRKEDATVATGLYPGSFRIRRAIRGAPLVSIIVPFRDGAELLRRCVASIKATAGYDRWELLLVDNLSWEPETMALLRRLSKEPGCRVVSYPHVFNWSAVNNFGVSQANGDLLLFLNSDVEGRSAGWLAAMVEHAQRPEVGAVGARLLYPDGTIQHAGIVMGLGGGVSWHPFYRCPGDRGGYLGHTQMIRNYSAVTGACLMVRRDVYAAVGGLDESLAVCFNDVDLCLRVRKQGRLVVYTPFAELVHYESSTRGQASPAGEQEIDEMFRRWASVIEDDPYFNPNLDRLRPELALPR